MAKLGRGSKEYGTWQRMKQRCLNPENAQYKNYGGRGITICPRWVGSFEFFLADMGPAPSKEHSIDRIDNDGPYTKNNCRWVTRQEQDINQRRSLGNRHGMSRTDLRKLAEANGMTYHGLHHRIYRQGMTLEEAIKEPSRYSKRKELEKLKAENAELKQWCERFVMAWKDGGINSADCLTALMAEGEGSDEKVYQSMAKQVLDKMRSTVVEFEAWRDDVENAKKKQGW